MMTKKLLDDRAGLTFPMAHPHPSPFWPLRMVAAAALLVLGAYGAGDVQALGLGRITVLSALGEPLRAEIEVPQVTPEEAATLKASIAGPAEFRGAGIEYNPALAGASISLQQRPDGRSFLRVSSDKPVNEPFVDLILEAKWASGQIVRNYTLLFDPRVPGEQRPWRRWQHKSRPSRCRPKSSRLGPPWHRATCRCRRRPRSRFRPERRPKPSGGPPQAKPRQLRQCRPASQRTASRSRYSKVIQPDVLRHPTNRPKFHWIRCWSRC